MKICSRCGTPAKDVDRFCTECGERFPTEEEEQRVSEEVYRESTNHDDVDTPPVPYLESFHEKEPVLENIFKYTLEGIKWMKRYFLVNVFLGILPYTLAISVHLIISATFSGALYDNPNILNFLGISWMISLYAMMGLAVISTILLIIGTHNLYKGRNEYSVTHSKHMKIAIVFLILAVISHFLPLGTGTGSSFIFIGLALDQGLVFYLRVFITIYVVFAVIIPLGYIFSVLGMVQGKAKKLLIAAGALLASPPFLLMPLFMITKFKSEITYIFMLMLILTAMAYFIFYLIYKKLYKDMDRVGMEKQAPSTIHL